MSNKLTLSLASAALLGMLAGCGEEEAAETPATEEASAEEAPADAEAGAEEGEQPAAAGEHACAGMNECTGQGGCHVEGANSCAGMNDCKGKGGCCTLAVKKDCPAGVMGGEGPPLDAEGTEEKTEEG